jgi:hypothetical protein
MYCSYHLFLRWFRIFFLISITNFILFLSPLYNWNTLTVVWTTVVSSLDLANKYLQYSRAARDFVGQYMSKIVSILLHQQPILHRCIVHESLTLALDIISIDLKMRVESARHSPSTLNEINCETLNVLSMIFDENNIYYSVDSIAYRTTIAWFTRSPIGNGKSISFGKRIFETDKVHEGLPYRH